MTKYRILSNEEEHGPYSKQQLKAMHASGVIAMDALYWTEGLEEWHPVAELSLGGQSQHEPPPLPAAQALVNEEPKSDFIKRLAKAFGAVVALIVIINILSSAYNSPPRPVDKAKNGDARALCDMGYMYLNGQGVPKDDVEAIKWFRLAADQGDAFAQYTIGKCYHSGEGVPRDHVEAIKWFRLATQQGDPNAQAMMGFMYQFGQGVRQDYIEAYKWFNLAASNGLNQAGDLRDDIAKSMGRDQIAEAQKLSKEWNTKVRE